MPYKSNNPLKLNKLHLDDNQQQTVEVENENEALASQPIHTPSSSQTSSFADGADDEHSMVPRELQKPYCNNESSSDGDCSVSQESL